MKAIVLIVWRMTKIPLKKNRGVLSVEKAWYPNYPAFALTHFRIHELIVRKENMYCGFYNVFLEYPNFVVLWKRFLHQIKNSCPVIQSGVPADSYHCNMKYVVRENFVKGGKFTLLCFNITFPISRRFGEACSGDV